MVTPMYSSGKPGKEGEEERRVEGGEKEERRVEGGEKEEREKEEREKEEAEVKWRILPGVAQLCQLNVVSAYRS